MSTRKGGKPRQCADDRLNLPSGHTKSNTNTNMPPNMLQNMAGFNPGPDGTFPNFPGMNMMNGMTPGQAGPGDFGGMVGMMGGMPMFPGQTGSPLAQGQGQMGRTAPVPPATAPTGPASFRGSIRGRGGAARGMPAFRGRGGARESPSETTA
jgi:hypothetical protein